MAANQKMENSNAGEMSGRLVFLKNLQTVTNKIHATSNIDEIMLEMSQDICDLFNCDRLTIYVLSEDKQSVVSKVKTGLNSFKDLKLPISEQSVAGYVAETRKAVNIRDVYDDVELTSYSPRMQFLKEVDKRTGYRSKQMLVAPILDAQNGALLGVVQLINSRSDAPFSAVAVEGVQSLAQTLAIAFTQRQKPRQSVRSKYDGLVADAVISADELDLAQRSARRKGVDLEDVLMKEFQVKLPAIGASLSKFFSVPYEPFKGDRIKPMDLLKNLKRDYVEANHWLPIEETPEGVVVISMDPERIKSSRVVNNIFPKSRIVYRVTTNREFAQTIDQYFGALSDIASVGDLLSDMGDEEAGDPGSASTDDLAAAADNELVRLVNKIIIEAYQQGASDIHIEPRPGKEKDTDPFPQGRLAVALYRNSCVVSQRADCPHQDHV